MQKLWTLWILVLLLPSASGWSQKDSTANSPKKRFRHQIGVNPFFFLEKLTTSPDANFSFSPFAISYKYVPESRWAFRFGLGASVLVQRKTSLTELYTTKLDLRNRFGFERQIPVARNWAVALGFDGIADYALDKETSITSFDVLRNSSETISVGGGPVLGVIYRPVPRITLYTETQVYFRYEMSTNKQTSDQIPAFNMTTSGSAGRIVFMLPFSLFFTVNF
jgi:hypothetical protein